MLFVHSIIEGEIRGNYGQYRVIHSDPQNDLTVLIDIAPSNPTALPLTAGHQNIVNRIKEEEFAFCEQDPYEKVVTKLSKGQKNIIKRRLKWVTSLEEHFGTALFYTSTRNQILKVVEEDKEFGTRKTLLTALRLWWKSGRRSSGLMGDYGNCGKNPDRNITTKLGRPRRTREKNGIGGKNLTADDHQKIKYAINDFFTRQDPKLRKNSLNDAYVEMIARDYSDILATDEGVSFPIYPGSKLPSLAQFRSFYYEQLKAEERLGIEQSREGNTNWQRDKRGKVGNATLEAFGPGSIYQTDATIGDIYLVASYDRRQIIGRPVIYIVVDVFSHMIVGFSVDLEGPSWVAASRVWLNVVRDKVEYYDSLGFTITEDEYPTKYLPHAIQADRGEMISNASDQMIVGLKVREIANTPSFRPDWNSLVEGRFPLINNECIHWTPGAVIKKRERGTPDYRLDAQLTLFEFEQLIARFVLAHNRRLIEKYPKDKYMVADEVSTRPIDLFIWGQRRSGSLRTASTEEVYWQTLPRKNATVTPNGIRVNGFLHFDCETAQREGWFSRARKKQFPVEVGFHGTELVNTIFLFNSGSPKPEECWLTKPDERFANLNWYEAKNLYEQIQIQQDLEQHENLQTSVTYRRERRAFLDGIPTPDRSDMSKSQQTANIRENRKTERALRRLNDDKPFDESAQDMDLSQAPNYVPPPSDLSIFRESREFHTEETYDD